MLVARKKLHVAPSVLNARKKYLYFIFLECNTVPPAGIYYRMPTLRSSLMEQPLHCEENRTVA